MPPKKITNNTQPKVLRRRVKKDKCIEENQDEVRKNVLIENKLMRLRKHDINIVLSNEVLRTQLPLIRFVEDPSEINLKDCSKYAAGKVGKKLSNKKQLNNGPCDPGPKPTTTRQRRALVPRKFREPSIAASTCNEVIPGDETEIKQVKKPSTGRPKKIKPVELSETVESKDIPKVVKKEKPKIIRKRNLSVANKPYSGPRTRRKSFNSKQPVEVVDITSDNNSEQPNNTNEEVNNSNQEIDAISKEGKLDMVEIDLPESVAINVDKENNNLVRRSSITSELSWTKDISSSSSITCVTVSSKDFVRIDKKIPVLKLKNISEDSICEKNDVCGDKVLEIETVQEMDNGDVSKTLPNKLNDKKTEDVVDLAREDVNLSSSSSSTSDPKSTKTVTETVNKLNETLVKLSSKLKNFDIEIINWVGYTSDNNHNIEKIQNKLFSNKYLKQETKLLHHCEDIKRILSDFNTSKAVESRIADTQSYNNEQNNSTSLNHSHENSVFLEPISDHNHREKETSVANKSHNHEKEFSAVNKSVDINVHHHNTYDEDEDDALSLYAESITGIDTSIKNSIILENRRLSRSEEYIPKPVTKHVFEPITYNPTKIAENEVKELNNVSKAIVCEKENADSTSTCRDTDTVIENDIFYEDRLGDKVEQECPKAFPKLSLFLRNKSSNRGKSQIFKGMCFFNLMSSCNRMNACKFPHVQFEVADMKKALKSLDNDTMIQEYILMRSFSKLKRKYGLCYVEEFIKRNLLRIVVEIAMDFVNNNNFTTEPVTMEIIETTLLYLNSVDLSLCDDLLQYKVKPSVLLCDCFLGTIAISQNFSRFKTVFINLTDFVFRLGRRFNSDTALHILERVVILPYDEGLAQALMKIIRNTDVRIFSTSMIGHLEQRLLASNLEIYNEFRTLKENAQTSTSVLGNCYQNSSHFSNDVERSNIGHVDKNAVCSPDTTNLDPLVPPMETIFTRTIDLNKIKFIHTNGHLNSSSSESDDRKNKWSEHSNTLVNNELMRPPLRRPFKRRSDMIFCRTPNKFQRRSGPNPF